MSVLNFLLKNLQGCCLLFNYQGSFFFVVVSRDSLFILSHSQSLVNNLFIFLFCCLLRSSLSFETAYLEYHFLRHLSIRNLFFFQSSWSCFSSNLIFKDCFLLPYTWALKHFPVLSHATACIIYHACSELSILFLLFILFTQFVQF